MKIDDYQKWATSTRLPTADYSYLVMGLVGEVGEFYSAIAKNMRDKTSAEDTALSMAKELGDIVWFISNIATDMGISMSDILLMNQAKLASRKERGTLSGSGDDR